MILMCPECQWGTLQEDNKIASRGGPQAFNCELCQTTLSTMDEIFGVALSSASEAAETMINDDHLLATVKQEVLKRPSKGTLDMSAPVPGQLVIGLADFGDDGSTRDIYARNEGTIPAMAAMSAGGAPRTSGPLPIHQPGPAPDATHISLERPKNLGPTPPKAETSSGNGAIGVAVGCGLIALVLIVVAGLGFGAYYFLLQDDNPEKPSEQPTSTKAVEEAEPERVPVAERIHDLVESHSGTSIPAIGLPDQIPQEGDVLLLTPNGIVFNKDMVATVVIGRVDPSARPNDKSPLILPLARQLETTFTTRIKDELDAEAEPRRVVVIGDGKVPYSVLYSALYTAWYRGAHLNLAAKSPSNPNAYLTIEVVAEGWPAPIQAGAPEDLPPQNAARSPRSEEKVLTVNIHDEGFHIMAPGQTIEDAVFIEKITVFPVQKLKRAVRKMRTTHPDATSIRIKPSRKTSLFILTQTIGAMVEPWGELKRPNEIRLSKPK